MPSDSRQAARDLYDGGVPIVNDYSFDPGVCVLPVAEDDPGGADWSPVVVCRLHAPVRTRTVSYSARKQQNPPVVPTPGDAGAFVFTGGSVSMSCSLNTTQLNADWGAETEYTFVENCRSRPQDGLVLGKPPYTTFTAERNRALIGPAPPATMDGAVKEAGLDARVGFNQGYTQAAAIANNQPWSYNTTAFFPGQLFDPNMINGGAS